MSVSGRPQGWRAPRQTGRNAAKGGPAGLKWIAACGVVFGLLGTLPAVARPLAEPLASVPLARLPVEAQATYRLIRSGGPFRHAKDGSVFGNRERLLPREPRGYYLEYTVPTPGSRDRGARRIVCGGQPPADPAACWYTADHYASFQLIAR